MKLEAIGLEKTYQNESVEYQALRSFSYIFPEKGLVSICGKSGCGKTTVLNLLSMLDKPSKGRIMYNRSNANKWRKNKVATWRSLKIGMVFQHYNLLEQETVLDNLSLPLLISGYKEKDARKLIESQIERFNFTKDVIDKNISDMSGGERQRIAILRAIINNPEVLFCDEPTGALDTSNSELVMNLLKEISKETLVIMVSHNQKLVDTYSDVVINMSDGAISSIEERNIVAAHINKSEPRKRKNNFWNYKRGIRLIKQKPIKNLLTSISLLVCLLLTTLIVGFVGNYQHSIINQSYKSIDYGVMTVSHQEKNSIQGSSFSVIKESRPSIEEIDYLKDKYSDVVFLPNISYFIPSNSTISYSGQTFEDLYYVPVYSFKTVNESLLLSGRKPSKDGEVLINKAALNKLNSKDITINIKNSIELSYQTYDENNTIVNDLFIFDEDVKVVGVVDDFSFLSTPKIYYSYIDKLEMIQTTELTNLSLYFDYEVTMHDYLMMASDNSDVSSYNYYCFYNDINHYKQMDKIVSEDNQNLVFYSSGIERKNACLDLISICSSGAEIFLAISIVGTVFILGIVSLSIFLEDRKKVAIITVLGAKEDDILTIYLTSNMVVGFISIFLSFLFSPIVCYLLNLLLGSLTGISGLIKIPFLNSLRFPLILIISLVLVIFLSTVIPIKATKKIALREELANND